MGAREARGQPWTEEKRGQGAEGASRQPRTVEKRGQGEGKARGFNSHIEEARQAIRNPETKAKNPSSGEGDLKGEMEHGLP